MLALSTVRAQVPNYQLLPEDLVGNFQEGIKSLRAGQSQAGFQSLDQALAALWGYQIQDLPAYSMELIRLCQQAHLPAPTRDRLLKYSHYFAPHSAEAAFGEAQLFLSPGAFSPSESYAAFQRGLKLLDYDLLARLRIQAMAWMGAAGLIKIFLVILSLLVVGRYSRPFLHWFSHLWPKPARKLSLPALLLILLIPFFVGAPFWMVLAWPAVLCLGFATDRIKGIYMLVLLLSVLPGFFEQKAKDLIIPLDKGAVLSQLNLDLGIIDENDLALLRSEPKTDGSTTLTLALAEAERRAGKYDDSSALLLSLAHTNGVSAFAYNQLGALHLEFNQVDQAIQTLESAQGLDPGSAEIYYNLSQAYGLGQKYDQSDQAYQKARELDEQMVARVDLEKSLLKANVVPVRMSLPAQLLEKELVPVRAWSMVLKSGRGGIFLFILGFILLLAIGLRNQVRTCRYCGRIICPKCLPESREIGVCGPCHQIYFSGKAVDPKLKMEQKALAHNYHRLIGWIGIGLNLAVPGSGLFLEEKAVTGLTLMIWPVLFLSGIYLSWELPAMLVPGAGLWQTWVLVGAGIYLLFSLVSILLYLKLTSVEV